MSFIFSLLLVVFGFVFIILLSALSFIRRIFFGSPSTHKQPRAQQQQATDYADHSQTHNGKLIPKEEGEYVDFEEIK